jgi:hypothetical protein
MMLQTGVMMVALVLLSLLAIFECAADVDEWATFLGIVTLVGIVLIVIGLVQQSAKGLP